MTRRKTWLLLTSGVSIFLAGCAAVAGQGELGASLGSDPLSFRQQAAEVASNRVEVLFPPRRATLTSADSRQLDLLVRLIRDVDPVTLLATAYQAGAGDERANVLAARRALAVKRGLVARGVPARQLSVQVVRPPDSGGAPSAIAVDDRVTITWGAS